MTRGVIETDNEQDRISLAVNDRRLSTRLKIGQELRVYNRHIVPSGKEENPRCSVNVRVDRRLAPFG
jgi:hypothetical protein